MEGGEAAPSGGRRPGCGAEGSVHMQGKIMALLRGTSGSQQNPGGWLWVPGMELGIFMLGMLLALCAPPKPHLIFQAVNGAF